MSFICGVISWIFHTILMLFWIMLVVAFVGYVMYQILDHK